MKQTKSAYSFFIRGTLLVIVMILIRAYHTHSFHYLFLLWNLFLAFIPFKLSSFLIRQKLNKITWWTCFFSWLFFFPNAPYIITDLIHLMPNANMPIWFDAALIFAAALNGLWIGCISLMQMEQVWRQAFPQIKVRYFIIVTMLLSGFGVYLGRFLRFNSWDIIVHPFKLLHVTFNRIVFPWQYIFTWEITLFFAVVLFIGYHQLKILFGNNV